MQLPGNHATCVTRVYWGADLPLTPFPEKGLTSMPRLLRAVVVLLTAVVMGGQRAAVLRSFNTVVNLETTSEDSANVSLGDLDGDGDFDIILAKGRHTPLLDRVLINDGKGGFVASELGPDAGSNLHGGAGRPRWRR